MHIPTVGEMDASLRTVDVTSPLVNIGMMGGLVSIVTLIALNFIRQAEREGGAEFLRDIVHPLRDLH